MAYRLLPLDHKARLQLGNNSVVTLTPEGAIDVNPGAVVSHIFRKRMIRPFLALLLRHEDGTAVAESEFSGPAGAYMTLFWEVAESFFTMNAALMNRLQELFVGTVGISIAGGRMIATLLAGASSAGPSPNTGRKGTR